MYGHDPFQWGTLSWTLPPRLGDPSPCATWPPRHLRCRQGTSSKKARARARKVPMLNRQAPVHASKRFAPRNRRMAFFLSSPPRFSSSVTDAGCGGATYGCYYPRRGVAVITPNSNIERIILIMLVFLPGQKGFSFLSVNLRLSFVASSESKYKH